MLSLRLSLHLLLLLRHGCLLRLLVELGLLTLAQLLELRSLSFSFELREVERAQGHDRLVVGLVGTQVDFADGWKDVCVVQINVVVSVASYPSAIMAT